MKPEEYIKTLNYHGQLVNLGLDDYGQQYFFEYAEGDEIKEAGCGTYCEDYFWIIENILGEPEYCEQYPPAQPCSYEHCHDHGYCSRCPYNELVIERDARMRRKLENQQGDEVGIGT